MSKPIKWDKQELEKLILVENKSYAEIAPIFGAKNGSAVGKAARRLGIKTPIRQTPKGETKYKKEELEHYIFYEGLTPIEIGKILKVKNIWRILRDLKITIPDYSKFIPEKDKISNFNEDGTINNTYLPVPLEYTYPITVEIKINWKGNDRGRDLLYIPEENKWVTRNRFNKLYSKGNYDYAYWYNKWVVRVKDPENLTEEEVDRLIDIRYRDKLLNTKQYIKKQLLFNSRYECDFFCIKKDLVDSYIISRSNKNLKIFDYNFDQVPEIIKTSVEKFNISYSEISNGEIISGVFKTNYLDFIINTTDPKELFYIKFNKSCKLSNEEFLKRAREVHGDLYEYLDNIEDRKHKNDKIRIRCKRCGRIFEQTVHHHLRGSGCRICNMKYRDITNLTLAGEKKVIPFDEFVKRCREIHGDRYEYFEDSYTGTKNNVKIRDTVTGDIFYQNAYNHYHGQNNPHLKSSHGENFIEKWLKENFSEQYQKEVTINNIISGRNTDNVRIDFILTLDDKVFWIEYNGIQHYKQMEFFHKSIDDFEKQKLRDRNVRSHCNENSIILIEIPYTYKTYEVVFEILKKIVIDGDEIENTIIQPDIE